MDRADHGQQLVAVAAQAKSSPTIIERLLHLPFGFDALRRVKEEVFVERHALVAMPPCRAQDNFGGKHFVLRHDLNSLHCASAGPLPHSLAEDMEAVNSSAVLTVRRAFVSFTSAPSTCKNSLDATSTRRKRWRSQWRRASKHPVRAQQSSIGGAADLGRWASLRPGRCDPKIGLWRPMEQSERLPARRPTRCTYPRWALASEQIADKALR